MPDFPKDPSAYDVSAAIHTVISKLEHVSNHRETTPDEMVREFWAVVEEFPIPQPHKPSAYARVVSDFYLMGIPLT
jgi:hypothetical protein